MSHMASAQRLPSFGLGRTTDDFASTVETDIDARLTDQADSVKRLERESAATDQALSEIDARIRAAQQKLAEREREETGSADV